MTRLEELRSLVAMTRNFGSEPTDAILNEIASLEIDEARRLKREAAMRQRIAQDINAIFEGVKSEPGQSIPIADVPGLGAAIRRGLEEGVLEVTGATGEPAEPAAPSLPAPVEQPTIADKVAKVISESGVVAPDPVLARQGPDLAANIKRLEQWISRIAATGAGSGEVNFRWLDDVNRDSINDNWVLEYDAASKKFQFTKNIGPIESIKYDTSGTTQVHTPGMTAWNSAEDCLDVYHADGTVGQVTLENYIQVHNHTTSTLLNGTVVRFSGVSEDAETPTAVPHIADGTVAPLYTIGVLTADIPGESTGRATIHGKVRGLNTTGADVGETWQQGDLLWLSPTNPGKLTKVKPTAPDIVVSVGAVLKVSDTSGVILVRPTVWPRLYYGRFEHYGTISTTSINTSLAVTFTQTILANGFYINSGTTSRIHAVESGFYDFEFSAQLVSGNSSSKNFWMWARRNGTTSTTSRRRTINGNGVYDVITCNFALSLLAGEYIEIMYAVDDAAISLESTAANAFAPAAPSVTLTAMQVAL